MEPFYFFVFLIPALVLGVLLLAYRHTQKREATLVRLLEGLGFRRVPRRFLTLREGLEGSLQACGRDFQVHLRYPNRNSQGRLRLSTEIQPGPEFLVARQGKVATFLARLGLGKPLQTPDAAFDAAYRVTTDDEALTTFCFAREAVRTLVAALFEAGCARVACGNGKLWVDWEPFYLLLQDAPVTALRRGLAPCSALAEALPRGLPMRVAGDAPGLLTLRRFNVLAVFAWILTGAGLLALILQPSVIPPLDGGRLFRVSLGASLPVLALFTLAVGLGFRQKTWFTRAALKLAPIALAIPLLGWVGAIDANVRLDRSVPVQHETVALRIYEVAGKHTSYHMAVRSWRPGSPTEDLQVGKSFYEYLRDQVPTRDRRFLVWTQAGALGCEWVVTTRFLAPSKPSRRPDPLGARRTGHR